ncbi:MAG: hypothetical protein RL044_807 [Actinomycetota bacterium]|jgi:hypothetical protein
MLANNFLLALQGGQIDLNRVPSGTGIDFIVWPAMVAAFIYFVYVLIRKTPDETRNKDEQK